MADKKTLTEDAISKVITALATSADAESVFSARRAAMQSRLLSMTHPLTAWSLLG